MLYWLIRQGNHVCAFAGVTEIIGASIKNIAVLRIHFYYQVAITTLLAPPNIMLMDFVIRHEVTHLRLVRADP